MENEFITKEFLEGNLFEKAKIGAGSFPWWYEDKRYCVVITLSGVGGHISICVDNKETNRSIEYSVTKLIMGDNKLKKSELKDCLKFLNCPDEFDYDL